MYFHENLGETDLHISFAHTCHTFSHHCQLKSGSSKSVLGDFFLDAI